MNVTGSNLHTRHLGGPGGLDIVVEREFTYSLGELSGAHYGSLPPTECKRKVMSAKMETVRPLHDGLSLRDIAAKVSRLHNAAAQARSMPGRHRV